MSPSDAQPVRPRLGRRALLSLFCLLVAGCAAIFAWPTLRPTLEQAAVAARGADESLLLLAGGLFATSPASCGLLWRHVIVRAGGRLGNVEACARYGIGSLVNSFAPAHLGDIVRAALLLETLPPGARRQIVRCFGVVQGVRIATIGGLALASSLPVELAPIPMLVGLGAFWAFSRDSGRLLLLALLGPLAKVGAVASVLAALGMPAPLRAALTVVPALELASFLPLTPANLGVASAAATVALQAQGFTLAEAAPASIVVHGIETAAGMGYGAGSAILLFFHRSLRCRMGGDRRRDRGLDRRRVGRWARPRRRGLGVAFTTGWRSV